MKYVKRILMVAGALALAGILGAAIAPKAAHALVAAMVLVTNTSANPVPTVISGTPFEAALCHAFGPSEGTACGTRTSDFVVPSTTAAGAPVKRLIVENVSGVCTGQSTQLIAAILVGPFVADSVPNAAPSMNHYLPLTLTNTDGTETIYNFGRTTRMYFNPGDDVFQRTEFVETSSTPDAFCLAQVEGTLVTQ